MKRIAAALAVLAVLLTPVPAVAQLSLATARRAITTYEDRYWQGRSVAVSVGRCTRLSPKKVTCLSEIRSPGETTIVRDWATLLKHGIIRVHPGSFTTTIVLE